MELVIGHQMLKYGVLPVAGGLLDQPYRMMRDIQAALAEEQQFLGAMEKRGAS